MLFLTGSILGLCTITFLFTGTRLIIGLLLLLYPTSSEKAPTIFPISMLLAASVLGFACKLIISRQSRSSVNQVKDDYYI